MFGFMCEFIFVLDLHRKYEPVLERKWKHEKLCHRFI